MSRLLREWWSLGIVIAQLNEAKFNEVLAAVRKIAAGEWALREGGVVIDAPQESEKTTGFTN